MGKVPIIADNARIVKLTATTQRKLLKVTSAGILIEFQIP
jgi:hypothetical protein